MTWLRAIWAWVLGVFRRNEPQFEALLERARVIALEQARAMLREEMSAFRQQHVESLDREARERAALKARLQPQDHGPAKRWAMLRGDEVAAVISAAESQARLLAKSRGETAIELGPNTQCEIGWRYRQKGFYPSA